MGNNASTTSSFLSSSWSSTFILDKFTEKMKLKNGTNFKSDVNRILTVKGETSWHLIVYPNGDTKDSADCVSAFLVMGGTNDFPVNADVCFSIVDKEQNKIVSVTSNKSFKTNSPLMLGCSNVISHSVLLISHEFLLPNDTLTIYFNVQVRNDSPSQQSLLHLDEKKSNYERASFERLTDDFESMYLTDKFSDCVIVCGESKFQCHKNILASRSVVFDAMFSHDTEESIENKVDIIDLDEITVHKMIEYIYSGDVVGLEDNAEGLFVAADKYDLKELKQMCEDSLSKNISKENVMELLIFAGYHCSKKLRALAVGFIVMNMEEITTSPDWWNKLKGHPEIMAEIIEASTKVFSAKKATLC